MARMGRHRNDRLRAMRFALWAQHVPPQKLTPTRISGLLDIDITTASRWRTDWLEALSPFEIEGIPEVLTPRSSKPAPAATGIGNNPVRQDDHE